MSRHQANDLVGVTHSLQRKYDFITHPTHPNLPNRNARTSSFGFAVEHPLGFIITRVEAEEIEDRYITAVRAGRNLSNTREIGAVGEVGGSRRLRDAIRNLERQVQCLEGIYGIRE